jgi:hypothetical protein
MAQVCGAATASEAGRGQESDLAVDFVLKCKAGRKAGLSLFTQRGPSGSLRGGGVFPEARRKTNGRSDRIRTCDIQLPKLALYQAELRSDAPD